MAALFVAGAACSSESSDSDGTGGSTATGGTASGGTSATGGSVTGGTHATGGVQSTGGTGGIATGGTSPTGGTTGTGGSVTGGTTSTGGVATTGGTTNAGGTTSAGGTTEVGGTTTAGGRTGRGGRGGMGGTTDTTGVGGTTATGGTTNVGGAGGVAIGGRGGQGGGGDTGGTTATGGTSGGGSSGTGGTSGFAPCPATGVCNIMPVGDSITEGCCTAPMGGYRIELYHQVLTNNKNATFVGQHTNGPSTVDGQPFPQHHEGHGGWKISQIAGDIDNAIKNYPPHIVLLKIGTNDINGNDNVNDAPNRLDSLMNQIFKDAPDVLLVVSAIIPTTTDSKNPKMQTYNTGIKAKVDAAAAAGKHVLWVDNYKAFTDNANFKTALMADELHPNAEGYKVLGDSFYGVIGSYLPAK
jgi:lysophospholipase L1-like esterase